VVKPTLYQKINLGVIILIGIVLGYSYFFYPTEHPINCIIKSYTGKECSSCGISRAFSYFTHCRIAEGVKFNAYALHVFLFFIGQVIWRLMLLLIKKLTNYSLIIYVDLILTIGTFLPSFGPMLWAQLSIY
jgi:hypothetical protein